MGHNPRGIGAGGSAWEIEGEHRKRRVRKSRSSRGAAVTWPVYFRSREFGRHLFAGMAVLASAYAAYFVINTYFATGGYNRVYFGETQSQVRYGLGPPQAEQDGGRVYRYAEGNRRLAVGFSPAGKAAWRGCGALHRLQWRIVAARPAASAPGNRSQRSGTVSGDRPGLAMRATPRRSTTTVLP